MRNEAFGIILGASVLGTAAVAEVPPVVPCHSMSQGEEIPPQASVSPMPDLPPADAAALALYVSANHAVLAPRDWQCEENGGSSGSFLIVAPRGVSLAENMTGPGIQVTWLPAGTSGRFEVARVDAQLFPQERGFVKSVVDEGSAATHSFPTGPVPSDRLKHLTDDMVEFETPPDHDGLGTESWLAKGPLPIRGVAVLKPQEEGNVETAVIRLASTQDALAGTILADLEKRLQRPRF